MMIIQIPPNPIPYPFIIWMSFPAMRRADLLQHHMTRAGSNSPLAGVLSGSGTYLPFYHILMRRCVKFANAPLGVAGRPKLS